MPSDKGHGKTFTQSMRNGQPPNLIESVDFFFNFYFFFFFLLGERQRKEAHHPKSKKVLEAPKKSPIEEEEGQLLGPIGDNTTSLGKGTHTHTHTQICTLHFARHTYDKGMWCHVLQSNNTQHNTFPIGNKFHERGGS